MKRCLESNDELTLEMQNIYDEQKASMDEMIKQVYLLTDIMKGMQEDRARSRMDEERADEESVHEPEEGEPSSIEHESEMPQTKQEEARTAETKPTEEETLAEEESITAPPDDEASQEILEGPNDEPQEKKDEVIKRSVEFSNTLLYLQARTVHVPDEKVERFVSGVEGETLW